MADTEITTSPMGLAVTPSSTELKPETFPLNVGMFANGLSTDPGSGGITNHALLTGRDTADQHPMSAITGLSAALAAAVQQAKDEIINGAPGALDTLLELADALQGQAADIGAILSAIAGKADTVHTHVSADITDLVSGGSGSIPPRPTGFYLPVDGVQAPANVYTASGITLGRAYYMGYIDLVTTQNLASWNVQAGGNGFSGASLMLGVGKVNSAGNVVGEAMVDLGTAALTSALSVIPVPQAPAKTLTAGRWVFWGIFNGPSANPTYKGYPLSPSGMWWNTNLTYAIGSTGGWSGSSGLTAMPATVPSLFGSSTGSTAPALVLEFA